MPHIHEIVTFPGSGGQLSGTLQVPEEHPKGGVVLAHCFTCSRSLKVTRNLATGIEDGGYAVLRFDFTGLGESEGEFAETNVTTNVSDIEAAASYLEARQLRPCALVGHSLGGAATLLAAANTPSARAVVAVAAPFSPDHVRHLFAEDDVEQALAAGRATVRIAGRPFQISAQFLRDLERHCSPERIRQLGRPLLVVHGTRDATVEIEEGERIFAAAQQPRWFAAIPNADHLFGQQRHAEQAAAIIVSFLDTVL
ncbi:MAG: alpha/beta fold hydrolase [Gemmatimonadales bacterium]|nr:alpha/beta fold hydrolase [Gemmatimonadales bacterium]NIN11288.1 alpha/beta fold hydrolase [Gemmatimonadales bacterium]NIN49887.1 alpha/beta fold hydrolase [Gemmatimonadales bacterium]NIP07351.1 alpha/beta fold hydrolase [Gemmatimonadales bacterium]NIR03046.1 alpha/beta fold hydrolase [Gemmatimonadales bacterium]